MFTYEEHCCSGGLGSAVAEMLAECDGARLQRIGLPEEYCYRFGSREDLYRSYGLMPEQVAQKIADRIRRDAV